MEFCLLRTAAIIINTVLKNPLLYAFITLHLYIVVIYNPIILVHPDEIGFPFESGSFQI